MAQATIAIFASGTGTNANAIIEYFKNDAEINIGLIVTNKADAGVIKVAEKWKVEYAIISKADLSDEELVGAVLEEHGIDFIVLAGWLLLIPSYLVKMFKDRILNIHPALLPKFGGKGMYGHHVHQAVKASNEVVSGITIHKVNEAYDEGGVVAQHKVSVTAADSAEDVERKVRALELKFYPEEIKKFIVKNLK
jgi:phosphoribosylglycinamide formyltransferase 1